MFCHKCGSKISDGVAFCHKCGAKSESQNAAPPANDIPAATSNPEIVGAPTTPLPAQSPQMEMPTKKKLGKLTIIIGVVVMHIISFIVIAAISSLFGDKDNSAHTASSGNSSSGTSSASASEKSETTTTVEFPLSTSADAMKIFSRWAANHSLVGDYHLDLISDDDVDNEGNNIFLFTLETGGIGVFNMSIRKSDGYMEQINKFDTVSMDEWYQTWSAGEPDSGGENAIGSLSYDGVTLINLLGYQPDELNKIFGDPTGGTPITGELLYGGTEYYTYDVITFLLGEQGTVVQINVGADAVKMNDATLDRNRAGIIDLLGTPGYEALLPEDESGEGWGDCYIMEYTEYDDGTIATIEMPDADSKATTFMIARYDDVFGDEEYQDPSMDVADPNDMQNSGYVYFTDLLGTWKWQGKDVVDAALGIGGTKKIAFYSNGTCEGELATSGSVNGEFVLAFHPDNWSFLEYEQVLQVSAITKGWDWDSNGTPIQVPVNKTFNFKVSMSGTSLWLENVDNPDSKSTEYIKAN